MRKTNKRYVIYTLGENNEVAFLFGTGGGAVFLTLTPLFPKVFPNKKKAKRVLKRLDSYYKTAQGWHVTDLNIHNAQWRKKHGTNVIRLSDETNFGTGE